jgi:hypothetical protein
MPSRLNAHSRATSTCTGLLSVGLRRCGAELSMAASTRSGGKPTPGSTWSSRRSPYPFRAAPNGAGCSGQRRASLTPSWGRTATRQRSGCGLPSRKCPLVLEAKQTRAGRPTEEIQGPGSAQGPRLSASPKPEHLARVPFGLSAPQPESRALTDPYARQGPRRPCGRTRCLQAGPLRGRGISTVRPRNATRQHDAAPLPWQAECWC